MMFCPSTHELGPAIDGKRRQWRPSGCEPAEVCCYVSEHRRGRPLVLVHDLRPTSSAYEVRPLFECFRWKRPTFALDLPGFGLSDRAALRYSPALFGSVLAELCRKLRRADVAADVVALGRGSELAARVARDEPGLVRSLVMLEPCGLLAAHRAGLETLAARLSCALGERAARGLFAVISTRPMVRRALRSRFHGAVDEGLAAYAHASAQAPGAHRAPFAAMACALRPCDSAALFQSLTVPVLVVHDARGSDATLLEAFLRGRANRWAARIAPTRGMPHFEQRFETAQCLDRFWRALPRAAWDQAMR